MLPCFESNFSVPMSPLPNRAELPSSSEGKPKAFLASVASVVTVLIPDLDKILPTSSNSSGLALSFTWSEGSHPPALRSKDLPIFFVNDFKELTEEKLKEFLLSLESSESFNKEKLNVNYWENIVNKEKNKALLDTNLEQLIIENKLTTKYFKIKSFTKSWLKSKWKIIDFYYQKIISMFH